MSYLVGKDGTIFFPRFGRVEVSGLSTAEITDKLTEMLRPAINDVVVKVRVLNFRVTVTGEVRSPGPVSVPEESLTILEAIGMSGDFTEFSNRENVLVVREVDGQRTFKRLNVLTTEVFDSPYYYLQQGDLVYVEPLKQKSGILSNEARATFSIIGGVSSVVSLLVTIIAVTGTI
jgi:polysaccharide export outer membrane protein